MIRVTVSITIAAPPAVVWQHLEAIEDHTQWMQDAAAIRFVGTRQRGVGTEFECLTRIGPFSVTDRFVVTAWEPEARMAIDHLGAVKGTGEFRLRSRLPHRSRLRWQERLRFPWWMGGVVGEYLAWPVFRSLWARNLRRLRGRIESRL